jgi:hypothetical protein
LVYKVVDLFFILAITRRPSRARLSTGVIQSSAMTEYVIEWGSDADELATDVAAKLKDGWQLVGGPFAAELEDMPGRKTTRLYQAMVK